MSTRVLKGLLFVIGMVIIGLGLNVCLGGIQTLGWQGPTDFLTITDIDAFAVQDNHVRFIAGVWTGVGVFILLGAFFLDQLASVLCAVMVMIFIGGLARLSSLDANLILSSKITPSLLFELLILPLFGVWIYRVTRKTAE